MAYGQRNPSNHHINHHLALYDVYVIDLDVNLLNFRLMALPNFFQ